MADERSFTAKLAGEPLERLEAELESSGLKFGAWVRSKIAEPPAQTPPVVPAAPTVDLAGEVARAEKRGHQSGWASRGRQLDKEWERIASERREVERLRREAQVELGEVNAEIEAHNRQVSAYVEMWRDQGRQELEKALVAYRISGTVAPSLLQAIKARADALFNQWLTGRMTAASPPVLLELAAMLTDQAAKLTSDDVINPGVVRQGNETAPMPPMRPSNVAFVLKVLATKVLPGASVSLKDLPTADPPTTRQFPRLTLPSTVGPRKPP